MTHPDRPLHPGTRVQLDLSHGPAAFGDILTHPTACLWPIRLLDGTTVLVHADSIRSIEGTL